LIKPNLTIDIMNIIKLLIISTLFASNLLFASNTSGANETINTDVAPPTPYARENDGIGGNGPTPIDDYAPILIVTAITIAGYFSYRQRQIIKK